MADSQNDRINAVLDKWHGRIIPVEIFEKLAESCGIDSRNLEYMQNGNFIVTRLPDNGGYEILNASLVRLQFHLPVLIKARAKYGLNTVVTRVTLEDLIQWYWQASNDSSVPQNLEPSEVNFVLARMSDEIGRPLEISLATIDRLCSTAEELIVEFVLDSLG